MAVRYRQGRGGEDEYLFDIKIHSIDVPDGIRDYVSERELSEFVQDYLRRSLDEFVTEIRVGGRYPWYSNLYYAEGRSGGWLVLIASDGLLSELGAPAVYSKGRAARKMRRLKDLEEIGRLVHEGKAQVKRELADPMTYPEEWRATMRKRWRPRDAR